MVYKELWCYIEDLKEGRESEEKGGKSKEEGGESKEESKDNV